MKTRNVILLGILILGIIGGSIAIYMYNKPIKNYTSSKADFKLTAKTLFDEFDKDQITATAKYVSDDKTVQVSGVIAGIKKNDDATMTILFDVASPDNDISCTLTAEESKKATDLKPEMTTTVKGQCTGFQELINREVIMMRCGIVK